MAGTNPRIAIELEAGADPIRGTIDHADGHCLSFWGWLELIDELRRVAAGEATLTSLGDSADARSAPGMDAQSSRPEPRNNTRNQP